MAKSKLSDFGFDRGALAQIIREEVGHIIKREVKKLIRREIEEKFERMMHKAVWGPIEKAQEANYRAEKRKQQRLNTKRHNVPKS